MSSTEDHQTLPRYDYYSLNNTQITTIPSTMMKQPTLEEILNDRDALDCFKAWILDDLSRSVDTLDLYFAIIGFKNAVNNNDMNALTIAAQLHRRFISSNTGSCDFIPSVLRIDMSNKVHGYVRKRTTPPSNIFDSIQNIVIQELRKQYSLFINSERYNEYITRYSNNLGNIPPIDHIDDNNEQHLYVNEETFDEIKHHTTTIASSSVVGSSIIDDECQPSTSNNIHHHHHSNHLPYNYKNKQINNSTTTTLDDSMNLLKISTQSNNIMTKSEPNVAQKFKFNKNFNDNDEQFNGCTTTLMRKHKKDGKEHRRNKDHRNPQNHSGMPHDRPEQRQEFANKLTQKLLAISDEIEMLEKQFNKTIYAREIPEYRLLLSNGQYSNQINQHFNQEQEQQQNQQSTSYMNPLNYSNGWNQSTGMTQSYHGYTDGTAVAVAAQSGFDADEEDEDITRYEQKLQQDRSNSISPAPFSVPKAPRDRHFSPYGNGGFAPPPSNKTKNGQFETRNQANHGYIYGNGYFPQSSAVSHLSFSDSSGVFSAESAHIAAPIDQFKMKKLFEKARETNAMSNNQTLMRKNFCNNQQQQSSNIMNLNQSQTLPRPPKASIPESTGPKMIVSLREPGQMPFVSHLDPKPLTFKEFRRLFGISSRSTKRIFFKSASEDGNDPYQWTAIERDDQIVPQFDGKITAECRTLSDSD